MLKMVAPLAVLLEGGYNLTATAASVEQVLRVLLGERPATLKTPPTPTPSGRYAVAVAQMVQCKHWSCLGSFKVLNSLQQQPANNSQPTFAHSDSHQFEVTRFDPLESFDNGEHDVDVPDLDGSEAPGLLEEAKGDLPSTAPFAYTTKCPETPPPDLPAISESKEDQDFGLPVSPGLHPTTSPTRPSRPSQSDEATPPKHRTVGDHSPQHKPSLASGIGGSSFHRLQYVRGLHIAALRSYNAKRKACRQLTSDVGSKSPKPLQPTAESGYASA